MVDFEESGTQAGVQALPGTPRSHSQLCEPQLPNLQTGEGPGLEDVREASW